MSRINWISPLQNILTQLYALLESQQGSLVNSSVKSRVVVFNHYYLANIAATSKKLNHVHEVLKIGPNPKAEMKIVEYAGRIKACLERLHLREKVRTLKTGTSPFLQTIELLRLALKSLEEYNLQPLPVPQRSWLPHELLVKEAEFNSVLADAFIQSEGSENKSAECTALIESERQRVLSFANIQIKSTAATFEITQNAARARL